MRLPFIDIIPFLEDFSAKGIDFDFGEAKDSDWIIDATDYVKLISFEEHQRLLNLENRLGLLSDKASETELASEWFYSQGVNYLSKVYLQIELNLPDEMEQVLDYLNALWREKVILEDNPNQNPEQELLLSRELEASRKASYGENLAKAPVYFERFAKKMSQTEDWQGIIEVFKVGDFKFFQLLSEEAKDRESAMMQHCVGAGGYDLSSGIYSLRNPLNVPLATIEIDENGKIIQIQGMNNKVVAPEAFVPLKNFITTYLKLSPEELNLSINIGWTLVKLTYPDFGSLIYRELYLANEELPISVANKNYEFQIRTLNWKEQLLQEFTLQNTPKVIQEKVIKFLNEESPFKLMPSVMGSRFDRPLKLPNVKRFSKLEELATLIHSNLNLFDEASVNLIRSINFKINMPQYRNERDIVVLLIQLDMYFQKGANSQRWNTLNEEEMYTHLALDPVKTFTFYKKYLSLLKELNPDLSVKFDPAYWLEIFGTIFPDNLLEASFLKVLTYLKKLSFNLEAQNELQLTSLLSLFKENEDFNPAQIALINKHRKNLQHELKNLNSLLFNFIKSNEDFLDFFSSFDIQAFYSFDAFVLETNKEQSKQLWLLKQQINFVVFKLKGFKNFTPENIQIIKDSFLKVFSLSQNLLQLIPNGKKNKKNKARTQLIEESQEILNNFKDLIEDLTNSFSPTHIPRITRLSSQVMAEEILSSWQESLRHSVLGQEES